MNRLATLTLFGACLALGQAPSRVSAGDPIGECCYDFSNPGGINCADVTEAECNALAPPLFWRPDGSCSTSQCVYCLGDYACGDGNPCTYDVCNISTGLCIHDTDNDNDGVLNCSDGCPNNPRLASPGPCGCNDSDADSDGQLDCVDSCPNDASNQCIPQAPAVSTWGVLVLAAAFLIGIARKARRVDANHC